MVRAYVREAAGHRTSPTSASPPAEIGGGFGGKTVVYLEPLALALSQEGRPAGEDGDDARGSVPRLRPDLGRARWR